jgi:PST family polysaccharide transporter
MAKSQLRRTMEGAFILTIASFIAKVLSAVYRVPFQNLVGDEGFYVYQQVYPIYGMAMTLALSGLPQFISRIIAEQSDPQKQRTQIQIIYPYVFWTAISLWAVTFFFAGGIAKVMGDVSLTSLVRVVSFTFLFVPPLTFYRGVFQGNLQMIPTAVSQVVEQLLRVGVILVAASFFRLFSWDVYQTGTLAMAGALLGGLAAWGILGYYSRKINGRSLAILPKGVPTIRASSLKQRFLIEGGLLTVYSGFLILFQLADSFLLTNSLEASGLTQQSARIAKGIYDRGQPVVQLGLVVAMALSSTFLPTLTKYLTVKNQQLYEKSAKMYLRLTVGIASASAVGLAILLPYINFALFKDGAGNNTLVLFIFAVVLMATIQAYQSIQQSRNHFRTGIYAAGCGLVLKYIITWPLTYLLGTPGASLSTLVGLSGTLLYFVLSEKKALNRFWTERGYGKKLLLCLGVMAIALFLYYGVVTVLNGGSVTRRLSAFVFCLGGVLFGGTVFITMALKVQLLTIREWLLVPFGKKLLKKRWKK